MSDAENVFESPIEKEENTIEKPEIEANTQEPEIMEQKPVKKKARKPLSEEQKERLRAQLKKGRETSLLKRQTAAKEKKDNTVILTKAKKKEIHKEVDTEEQEKERLNKDIADLRHKLTYLMDQNALTKQQKEEVKEIKKEIKIEAKKEEPKQEQLLIPKSPPPPPEPEPEPPKKRCYSKIRGGYYYI